jgi:UDPglucose 6-dehydrogenase
MGGRIRIYDPVAMDKARESCPELEYAGSVEAAASDADLLLLLTEWPEFRDADPGMLGKIVAQRRIADGRNALDPAAWREAGWDYRALGRPALKAATAGEKRVGFSTHRLTKALDRLL